MQSYVRRRFDVSPWNRSFHEICTRVEWDLNYLDTVPRNTRTAITRKMFLRDKNVIQEKHLGIVFCNESGTK